MTTEHAQAYLLQLAAATTAHLEELKRVDALIAACPKCARVQDSCYLCPAHAKAHGIAAIQGDTRTMRGTGPSLQSIPRTTVTGRVVDDVPQSLRNALDQQRHLWAKSSRDAAQTAPQALQRVPAAWVGALVVHTAFPARRRVLTPARVRWAADMVLGVRRGNRYARTWFEPDGGSILLTVLESGAVVVRWCSGTSLERSHVAHYPSKEAFMNAYAFYL